MKFYNREKELAELQRIRELAFSQHSRMVVVTGRRRIGKTSLVKEALKDSPSLYFFVGRKAESVLVAEFVRQVREHLGVFVPEGLVSFSNLMQYLFELGKGRAFSIVVDEFQEFCNINESVFSDLQNLWDTYRKETHVNLVISGSVYSLMQRIFTDKGEPLFGRADNILRLHPFCVDTLRQIMDENAPGHTNDDLLALYTLTGGIPKYVELLCDNGALSVEAMYRFVFSELSPFIEEGRYLLITEFGKNYGTYFSILQEIANGHYAQGDIEARLGGIAIGGHLNKLENVYRLIRRERPMFAKPGSKKNVRYVVHDNFLNFWFRYIEKNQSYVELRNFDDLYRLAIEDYPTYSGRLLEKYFRQKLAESGGFKAIGGWWESKTKDGKGSVDAHEIDIVALRAVDDRALVAEVKRNPANYNHKLFMEKVDCLRRKEMMRYEIETKLFTLADL